MSATSRSAPVLSREPVPALPLVLGITGHRDLREEDREALEAFVGGVFTDLRARYPHTPLTLLSPLAEGADRLAARVALESGVRLIVPLPMPRELYEGDFPTSRAEFDRLLKRADEWFELPILPEYAEEDIRMDGDPRNRQYEQVGAFIARHSQILLALWDGEPTGKVGGTGEIVRFQLEGVPDRFVPHRSPLDRMDSGPVYHFVTPRISNRHPKDALTFWRKFPARYDDDVNPGQEAYDQIFRRMDTFNRDANTLKARIADAREKSKGYVFPGREDKALPDAFKALLARYALADALALHFQRSTYLTLDGLFWLTFFAVLSFAVHAHVRPDLPLILGLYPLLMGVTVLWYLWTAPIPAPFGLLVRLVGTERARDLWAKRGDFQNKFQDYRALAEGLRVQFFWRLGGLTDSVGDHYLLKQKGELDWIRQALRVWSLPTAMKGGELVASGTAAVLDEWKRLILDNWVRDQEAYYTRAVQRDHKQLEKRKSWEKRSFVLGLGLAAVLTLILWTTHPWLDRPRAWIHDNEQVHEWLILLITLAAVVAALIDGHAHKKALAEHVKQYDRMSLVFDHAEQRLSELMGGDWAQAQRVILNLGDEALAENGDWLLLHRERPLDVVQAG